MNSDEGFVPNGDMATAPTFSYATLKQPAPPASMGGGDADEEDETGGSGGDMNGEASMNGDARMNTMGVGLDRMPRSSDPSISMDSPSDSDEPSAYSAMNKGAIAPSKAPAVMHAGVDESNDKRAALIKAMLSAGDLGLESQHMSSADMKAD